MKPIVVTAVLVALVFVGGAHALEGDTCPDLPLKMHLGLPGPSHVLGQGELLVNLEVRNHANEELVVPKGFSESRFYLCLVFLNRKARRVIRSREPFAVHVPEDAPMPEMARVETSRGMETVQIERVERLPRHWRLKLKAFDAAPYYALEPGDYWVHAELHTRTISPGNLVFDGKEQVARIETLPGDCIGSVRSNTLTLKIREPAARTTP